MKLQSEEICDAMRLVENLDIRREEVEFAVDVLEGAALYFFPWEAGWPPLLATQ